MTMNAEIERNIAAADPLMSEGWREFNRWQWRVEPELQHFEIDGAEGPAIEVVSYHDERGRFVLPPMNPHWPLRFRSTSPLASRCQRQWTRTAGRFVDEILQRGIAGRVALPPGVVDVRPWIWAGFLVRPLYTIFVDFPFEASRAEAPVRQKIRKAARSGYTCRMAQDLEEVLVCLRGTEARQHFRHELTRESLEKGLALLGPDGLRLYVCYGPNGEPASARIVLHVPGGRACDLAAGTRAEHLPSGATQALIAHALEDLSKEAATGLNFCGANLEAVAAAKEVWGGRLMPHYAIEAYDREPLLDLARDARRLHRARRRVRSARSS